MKRIFLPILISLCLAGFASGQKTAPRTFDNFDRAQGVPVYIPPAPPMKLNAKGKRGKRMGVVVQDKLVKRTAAVTDGLAQREPLTNYGGGKFTMGSNVGLKGFTTGNPMHDAYITESSRRY